MPIFKNTQPIFFKSRRKIYGFHQSGCHGSSDARHRAEFYTYFGMKQLMAGGGVVLIGTTLIPLLSGLFG